MAHTNLYHQSHVRVKKVRGNAREHQCQHCDRPAYEWATPRDKDSESEPVSPEEFISLCRSCHRKYDESWPDWTGKRHAPETIEKIRQAKIGKANHTPESRQAIGDANRGRVRSAETREKMSQAQLARGREPRQAQHGTVTEYRLGCRCDLCREAKRQSR